MLNAFCSLLSNWQARQQLFRRIKKTKNDSDIRKYKECKKALQKHERQAYWTYINGIIEADDPEVDQPPKQKRFWNHIKSLRKDSTDVSPLKDNGRLFNSAKDKADILNRQYQSVFTHEDPDIPVPDPDGDPYPDMEQITVTDEGVRKLLQKSNPRKATGPAGFALGFIFLSPPFSPIRFFLRHFLELGARFWPFFTQKEPCLGAFFAKNVFCL